jgi:hypothetical protein
MWLVALIINIFLPGVGSLFVGAIFQALAQMFLALSGALLSALGPFVIIGAPLSFIAWVWGIWTAVSARDRYR